MSQAADLRDATERGTGGPGVRQQAAGEAQRRAHPDVDTDIDTSNSPAQGARGARAAVRTISRWAEDAGSLWISPIALILVWWWLSARGTFPPQLLVPPGKVIATAWELIASGELPENLGITLERFALGIAAGSIPGLVCGILLATNRTFSDYVRPLFDVLRQVPTLTLIPVLVLLIGIDEPLKIVVVAKAVFFPIALAAYTGTIGVERPLVEMARHYGLNRRALLIHVYLPAALPSLLTGVRIAVARAWLALIAVELLSADSGIGEMMDMARQMLRIDIVLVDVIVVGLIGFLLDQLTAAAQRHGLRWESARR